MFGSYFVDELLSDTEEGYTGSGVYNCTSRVVNPRSFYMPSECFWIPPVAECLEAAS